MAATWTKAEIENAALVVVVDNEGRFTWSSTKTHAEVASALEQIAEEILDDTKQGA